MQRSQAAVGRIAVWVAWTVAPIIGTCAVMAQPPDEAEPAERLDDRADPSGEDESGGNLWTEEAIGRFQQLLERRPMHSSAFSGLVKYHVEKGTLPELIAQYEERVAALPDEVAAKIVLTRLYMRAGDAEKAAGYLEKIGAVGEELKRDESRWLALKAEIYQRVGRLEDAQAVLNQALENAKTMLERMRLAEALADMFIRAENSEKAVQTLTRLAGEYADNYLHRRRVADALAQRELHEAAMEQYREILQLGDIQPDQRCETLRELGRSLERLGRSQEAIDVYAEATGLLGSGHWLHQELHERIVQLYRSSGRLDDLVAYCRNQIERAPEQTAMRILLAEVLASTGDTDGARKVFAEATELFPKDRALSERRIQFLERVGDEEAVAAEYERLITQHPDDVELYIAYGQFLASHKHLEAARNQWKRVLNTDVADATLALRLGSLFEPYELYDDAVECYERAIEIAPARPEAYTSLARLWFFRGDRDKSLSTLKRLTEVNPEDAAIQASVCQTALGMGMNDEALEAITRACELAPGNVDHQLTRSNLLVHAGRLEEALTVRRETLDAITNPVQQALELNVLVSMYGSAGKLDALRQAEESRLEAKPADAVALLLLARAGDFDRDFAAARKWLTKLLEVDPAHEEARRQLAKLHEAVGDVDAAVAEYRRLIELHPNRARQSYQAIADAKLKYNDRAGAIDTFEKMVQSAPDNATVLKDVAEQLVRLGEYEKGLNYYEESLRLGPDRHEVRLEFGKALVEAGRLDQALDEFKFAALQRTDRDSAAEAMTELHETASQLGELDTLIDELQNRLELDPTDTLVARTLAGLLIDEFEYNRVMGLLDMVLRHRPRDVELQLTRAELLRRLARFDDAIEQYRRILRAPDVDRDFLLGELGKTYFEAGQLEAARKHWRQVTHKLYAGTLLRNNGLLKDAVEVLQEGIRLKPDDFGLHRNLVRALQMAGRTDEALQAAERLLDLEPDNIMNIRELAKAHLERGDRQAASKVAARLFSAGVAEKSKQKPSQSQFGMGGSVFAASLRSAWGSFYGSGSSRSNLDAAVTFFQENGLHAELEEVLQQQIEAQPANAVLRETAAGLFSGMFGKPESALHILKELETAEFPVEHQNWLGQCSQRDFYRMRQYELIAQKPALRDARLAELEAKPDDSLFRDEIIELAAIRQAQGQNDKSIELLQRAVEADAGDVVAVSALIDALMRVERFQEAEPHVETITSLLSSERERLRAEMIERVRRDFVRSLPLRLQLRVTEDLLADIAHKWTLGRSFAGMYLGGMQSMGYHRARLALGTIYAKTDRMDQARAIWEELAPAHPADVDGWTTLAGVAQLHEQQDAAFRYYAKALDAARALRGDQLLQRVYGGSMSQLWYSQEEAIDSSFNKIVQAFATNERLIDLYDFLRETDQTAKARRIAEQYELYDDLKTIYRQRLDKARAEFVDSSQDPLDTSVPYFTEVCKLAELYDSTGDWPEAEKIYQAYVEDFPDELALLTTLGEVAERLGEYEQAIDWEKKVIAAKERLVRQARAWVLRDLALTPMQPQILQGEESWSWTQRWGRQQWWGYGGGQRPLDVWPSWIRIAQLFLAVDNIIASSDAMERAIAAGGRDRESVAKQVLALIRQRQLVPDTLPVLRSLAVHLPTDQDVQIAFAESLESNDRGAVAVEVYRRLLRRGVSDVGKLTQVRQRLGKLAPDAEDTALATLDTLEADVKADPDNANKRLRLAKAYYYSLRVDDALATLLELVESAPHLEGVHDLLIEIYTLQNDSDRLVEALRTKIDRIQDEGERVKTRERLLEELLTRGDVEEALEVLKLLADPKKPQTFEHVALLLHYYGRHDEAVEQFETATRSQSRNSWRGDRGGEMMVRSTFVKGDRQGAVDKLLESIDQQLRQLVQYGGMMSMYMMFSQEQDYFAPFEALFILDPEFEEAVRARLVERHQANPTDPQATKVLMQYYQTTGRTDLAEALLEELDSQGTTDQGLAMQLIDRAARKHDFAKAIEMAEKFIEQQAKPQLPPGMPAQFAGMMNLMSSRNVMLCKLGDLHWQAGRPDQAFEAYQKIVDKEVDETRVAYATICLVRDRIDEARLIVDEMLEKQQVKSPNLLQFRAILAAVDNKPAEVFDALADSLEAGGGQSTNPFMPVQSGNEAELLASVATIADQLDRFTEYMLSKRIAKNPNSWQDYQVLAKTLYEAGRIDQAFEILDKAANNRAVRSQALQERINMLEGYTTPEVLIPLYEEWIADAEKKVKSPGLLQRFVGRQQQPSATPTTQQRNRLGELLWKDGRQEEAVKVWTERLDQNSPATHVALGQRFLQLDEYDRARAAFEKAVELKPDEITAHQALATLDFAGGEPQAALEHLKEVFLVRYRPEPPEEEEDPTNPYAQVIAQQNRRRGQSEDTARLRTLAFEITHNGDSQADVTLEDADQRLAMHTLTGDWASVDTELAARLESAPFDPMVWTLWAILHERQGDWAEATRARERARRLAQTTIAQHREQLKLVLAGKQIQDASAGTKDTDAAMAAAAQAGATQAQYYYYNDYYGRPTNADTQRLAALYIKQGQYEQAERLILLSRQSGISYILSNIAGMMREQGAKERAMELSRLGLILGRDANQVVSYVTMLADAGQADEATQMLIRAYRCTKSAETQSNNPLYGNVYGNNENEFETHQERSISQALHRILEQAGRLNETLATLQEQVAEDRDDLRKTKLLLALQMQDRRWDEAKVSLAQWRQAQPTSQSVLMMELQVAMQCEDWTGALAVLDRLSELAPEQQRRWRMIESFVRLMHSDRTAAVAAVEPLLDAETLPQGITADQLWVILASAGDHQRLNAYLGGLLADDRLDDSGARLLFRVQRMTNADEAALGVALKYFWRSLLPPYESLEWMSALSEVAHALDPDEVARKAPSLSSEDLALLTLLRSGPLAGVTAFAQLVADEPDNFNAHRGLVFAALRAGDLPTATAANGALIEVLAPRRRDVWYAPQRKTIGDVASGFLEQSRASGLNTTMVLGISMSLPSLLQGQLQTAQQMTPEIKFEQLWTAHELWQAELLSRSRQPDALRQQLVAQATMDQNQVYGGQESRTVYRTVSFGMFSQVMSYPSNRSQSRPTFEGDWRKALREKLYNQRQFEPLLSEYEALGPRTPVSEWPRLAETCAVLGQDTQAQQWLRRFGQHELAKLKAADVPTLTDENSQNMYWRFRVPNTQNIDQMRASLMFSIPPDKYSDEEEEPSRINGVPDTLEEVAVVDGEIERGLLALAEQAGPGWRETQTVRKLVTFFDSMHRPEEIVTLLERVMEPEELLLSGQLRPYLQACYQTKDAERVENVLSGMVEQSALLESDVRLARLMLLRHMGQDQQADALEKELLGQCRTEMPNPSPVDPRLNVVRTSTEVAWQRELQRMQMMGGQSSRNYITNRILDVPTAASLARLLNVPYQSTVEHGDLTLNEIRSSYQRHGFRRHAARLVDLEMAAEDQLTPQKKAEYLLQKALHLPQSGDKEAAAQVAREVESIWHAQTEANPLDAEPYTKLASLYSSRAYGQDYAKAREALQKACALDPAVDAKGHQEAGYLFEMEQYDQAWNAYEKSITRGEVLAGSGILYKAGLASYRAGKRDTALPLLRQALWRHPEHNLAEQAREIIHD